MAIKYAASFRILIFLCVSPKPNPNYPRSTVDQIGSLGVQCSRGSRLCLHRADINRSSQQLDAGTLTDCSRSAISLGFELRSGPRWGSGSGLWLYASGAQAFQSIDGSQLFRLRNDHDVCYWPRIQSLPICYLSNFHYMAINWNHAAFVFGQHTNKFRTAAPILTIWGRNDWIIDRWGVRH